MLTRPFILKLFALFLFIDPLLRISFISIESEFSFFDVFTRTFSLAPSDIFNFWFIFPISGFLLLSVNLYSYFFFILIQSYSLYFHINYEPYSWPYLAKAPSSSSYLLLTINLAMVFYLLLPKSREVFFDKNLRWWERGSRYTINEPCIVKNSGEEIRGQVCDLAFGGALLKLDSEVKVGSTIELSFNILNKSIVLHSNIVRIIQRDDKPYFGVQFNFKNLWEKAKLKLLLLSVSKIKDYELYR